MNLFAHSQAITAAAGGAQSESSTSSAASSALDANLSSAHSKLRFGFWAPPSAAHVVEASSAFNAAAATAANAALDDADRLVFVPETARMRTLDALTSTLRKPEIWGMHFLLSLGNAFVLLLEGFVICLDSRRLFIVLNIYRATIVADNWTLREIALFEAAMCAFGKDFHAVQQAVSLKSV